MTRLALPMEDTPDLTKEELDDLLIKRARECAHLEGAFGPLTSAYVKVILAAVADRLEETTR